MKNIHQLLAVLCISFVASSCNQQESQNTLHQNEIIPVKLIPLQEGENGSNIVASGVFTTEEETVLSFKNGGIIQNISVKEGDQVRKGQVLATLNMVEIDASMQQANLGLEKAERDYQRVLQLFNDSVATKEQLENAKTAKDVAVQQNRAAQFNQNYSQIRATDDGYVLKRFANSGQTVGPGTPVLQLNGAGSSAWKLKIGVSDEQWAALKVGDKAIIETDLSTENIKASIIRKSEGIDPSSGTFTIVLQVEDTDGVNIATGVFARATITPSKNTSGWNIPYSAVLDGHKGEGYVFVTNDKKTVKRVQVKIGSISKDQIMIVGGLEPYQYAVASGSAYLKDGSKIKEQETAK